MEKPMTVTILGGTGFVGRHLKTHFEHKGAVVKAYGRYAFSSLNNLVNFVDHSDLLIVLAGENIGKRWSEPYKKALFDSRVETNLMLSNALKNCQNPPKKILSASAIGIYPENSVDQPIDESCEEVGDGFLGQLGQAWEESSKTLVPEPIIMRFGVVLGKNGGALAKMLPAFRLGLGGPVAGGKQAFSWIHIDDLAKAIIFLSYNDGVSGTYNLCAPEPLSNSAFGKTLAKVLNRPFWLPLPEWQLKLMFGEGAQVLTHSSAIMPTRLTSAGFKLDYPDAKCALDNLLR